MADWKEVFTHLAFNAEQKMDEMRYRMHYALGGLGPVKILTYRSYGNEERLYVRGRVIEDRNIPEAEKNDHLWENVLNMYKRLESNEVPYARLAVRYAGVEQEVTANEEGHFEAWITPDQPLAPRRLWHPVEIELLHPIPPEQSREPVKATAEVLVPLPGAEYVVISDIDDTIVRSDAGHLMKMARHVFLGNAHTRLPFPGVAALYRALHAGRTGNSSNPLFYVSSSPWNLYDLLAQFFYLQDIPGGPVLFLRDWGLNRDELLPIHHRAYKTGVIRQMLDFYPNLPFILIGDSGQEDPEIYADMVHQFPHRVEAVYIRNVSRDLKRPEAIRELAKKVVEAGSTLVLADDSLSIARNAAEKGLILAEALPSIHTEKNKDEAPPTPLEKMLGEDKKPEAPAVKVEGATAKETRQAVKEGAVEEAVKTGREEQGRKPPAVVVEGKQPSGDRQPRRPKKPNKE
jgi:phosphatidate phosphatase APP1